METHHNPSPIARGDYEEAVRLMNQGRPSVTGHLHPTTTKIPHGSDQSVGRTNFGLGALTG